MSESYDEFIKKKRCCVSMEGTSTFYQCIAFHLSSDEDKKKMLKHRSRQLFRTERGAQYGAGEPVIKDLPAFEKKWALKIKILEFPSLHVLYCDDKNEASNRVVLLKAEKKDRYSYVYWKQQGLLFSAKHKVCPDCDMVYRSVMHRCLETCKDCRNIKCESGRGNPKNVYKAHPCSECNRNFISYQCRQLHFGQTCKRQRTCNECNLSYSEKQGVEHVCYMHRCRSCGLDVDEDHQCFMQSLTSESIEESSPPSEKYIFFDYETCEDSSGIFHEVIAVAAVYDSDEMFTFNSTSELMDWAIKNYKGYTLISHYGGRFDMHFIKKWLMDRKLPSHDIATGRKLTECKIKPQKDGSYLLRLIDSFRFIPIALRNFGPTFDLEHQKTYFPHLFYNPETVHYKGIFPEKRYFVDKGKDFDDWYATVEGSEVDLYQMCVEYCKIDVRVMQQGCLKFRSLFLSLTQNEIDPFQCLTIASTVMKIYQRFHMPNGSIPLAPPRRDREKRAWWLLQYGQAEVDLERNYADLTGEHFKPHAIDGHTLYYMHTCVDVGCADCFTEYQLHPRTSTPMIHLRQIWKDTRKLLNENGLTVIETTACKVNHVPEEILPGLMYIDPRDAFYGGRTEPIRVYCTPKENEVIRYADYTSLYPSTQFCEYRGITEATYHQKRTIAYPVGHPDPIPHPRIEDLDSYFGFIHCKVLVPEDTFMPILPVRKDAKLMFMTGILVGTWTTMHVQKAVEKGATLLEIYHVLHYKESTTEMWRSYVSTFLRLKQQAAGWVNLLGPEDCENVEAQHAYIAEYLKHQGIQLVHEEIKQEKNRGMYYISKLCLNSLWGKFGQKEIFSQSEDVYTDKRYNELLMDNTIEITNIDTVLGADVFVWKRRADMNPMVKNTSVVIAAFTTAYAQLRLYEALEVLGEKVLYMDTDSVIYLDDEEKPALKMGSYLGDLTDELAEKGSIVEFVSSGPKCYAYRTSNGAEEVKTKGFSGGITMDQMREAVLGGDETFRVLTQPTLLIIDKDHTIRRKKYKENEGKIFRYTFSKRRVCEVDGSPYGTRPFKLESGSNFNKKRTISEVDGNVHDTPSIKRPHAPLPNDE